jgi:hypothetical protein
LKFRDFLKHVYDSKAINRVSDISIKYLRDNHIKALVLDFDGVLSPHGYSTPTEEVNKWLNVILRSEGCPLLFILSNNPSPERIDFFARNYPQIEFVVSERKKPFPHGLNSICARHALDSSRVVIVDDRLLTGVLAAANAGVKAIFIKNPYEDFKSNLFKELLFACFRIMDKLFILRI